MNKTISPIKAVHCIGSLGYGGIERLVCDLIEYQNDSLSIVPALGVNLKGLNGEFLEDFERLGITMHDFTLSSGYDLNPLKILKAWKFLKDFDVIHLHGFNLTIVLASLLASRKVIYTEHGNFGNGRDRKRLDYVSFFLRKLYFNFSKVTVVCNSKYTANVVRKRFYRGKRIVVVYNGIRIERTINKELVHELENKYSDHYIIGTSSRLAGFKRIDRLILAFKDYILSREDTKLVIVGDGPELSNLKNMVSEYGLEGKVIFEGYQKEVATYQSCFDLCVFPSIGEPFGLVAVECLTLGKPVLVFRDSGGMAEVVSHISPLDVCSDIPSLLKRLEFYRQSDFEFNDQRKESLDAFSISRMGQDYSKLYRD